MDIKTRVSAKSMRNSQIELMRILAMLMIIAHHYILYGVYQNYLVNPPEIVWGGQIINKAVAHLLLPGGIVGVAMFFIIAGYFGIQNDKVKVENIVFKTASYSLIALVIWGGLTAFHVLSLDIGAKGVFESAIKSVFPCASSTYWFVTIYIVIMLCKPVINSSLRKLSDGQLIGLFALLLVIYACLRVTVGGMLGLYQGMTYYLMGVILYRAQWRLKRVKPCVYLLSGVVGWIGYAVFDAMGVLAGLPSIVVMGTVSAFGFSAFFMCGKECCNMVINKVAASSLAVYLIHENPLLREVLWSKILHVETVQIQCVAFPFWAGLSIVSVFMICIAIDFIKIRTFDKVGYRLIDRIKLLGDEKS